MTFSLHQATVASFSQVLPALAGQIAKAQDFATAHGLADSALLEARLADDMWPLVKQVMAAVAHSAGAVEGVQVGETRPIGGDMPTSLAELGAVVADGVKRLQTATPALIDGIAGRDTAFRFGERSMPFTVEDYLLTFALPNFYFHASMAYAILRNQGVPVGKMDFLGAIRMKTPG